MENEQYKRMREHVAGLYPHFTEMQVIHACHLISNQLRKVGDIYEVEISKTPFERKQPGSCYYSWFDVKVADDFIYVQVTVD